MKDTEDYRRLLWKKTSPPCSRHLAETCPTVILANKVPSLKQYMVLISQISCPLLNLHRNILVKWPYKTRASNTHLARPAMATASFTLPAYKRNPLAEFRSILLYPCRPTLLVSDLCSLVNHFSTLQIRPHFRATRLVLGALYRHKS